MARPSTAPSMPSRSAKEERESSTASAGGPERASPAIASQKPRSAEVATEFRCVVRLFRTLDVASIFSFFLSGSSNTISLSIRSVHINSTHVLVSIRQLLSSRFSTQDVIWNLQASFYHYFNFVNRLGWTNDM